MSFRAYIVEDSPTIRENLIETLQELALVDPVGVAETEHEGKKWLERHGNPYLLSAYDDEGKVGIDFGVYGVPETFVIDKQGVIRYKQIGPITPESLEKTILPLVRELGA